MPSIDDFVSHRFADAKEELRKLDPGYVGDIECIVRVENSGQESPLLPVDENSIQQKLTPKKRLPKAWHRLLEACHELAPARVCFGNSGS